ncbi:hypothetical protein [Actinomadura harenae]|uniref:Uncharacterized protein n=1 Tax=Actinomadura harenae TaxID=2483351 RepID=A0A3M2M093_9ACTN|nr:hypothetical protein [Actinomadura harenae]RMI42906.1 hypothetical protein EBO15_17920 [Actinomadura harenae]
MTVQLPDTVHYRDRAYSLTGKEGGGLFDPPAHGLKPAWMSTGCYRGFLCEYAVADGALVLTGLEMGTKSEAPALFGVEPFEGIHGPRYEGLHAPVPFTGRLLLGDEFDFGLYVPMGYPSAWKFEEVWELAFEDGRLTTARDRSEDAARRRADPRPGDLPPPRDDHEATQAWIERVFTLGFDL